MPLTPTLVQSIANSLGGTSTVTATLNGTTAGNLLVVSGQNSSSTGATLSFSDGTNTYLNCFATLVGTGQAGRMAHADNIAGGNVTVTMTSTIGSSQLRIIFEEWSNCLTSSPIDQVATGTGTSTTPTTSATGTLANSGELVVCHAYAGGSSQTWTAGSGFILDPNLTNTSTARSAEYLVASGTGAQTGTFTIGVSNAWIAMLSTYQPAPSPSTNIQLLNRRYVQFYT